MGVTIALSGFGPITVAALRITIGAVLLISAALFAKVGLPDHKTGKGRRIWLHCIGFAVFTNALPFSLLSWAQLHVTSGFAGITMAVVPLFILPLARFFLGEHLTVQKFIGFLMGFAGVLVLVGPDALRSSGSQVEFVARLACVGASLCYATGTIITRTAPRGSLLSYSAAGLLLGALMIAPIAFFNEGLPTFSNAQANLAAIGLGLFPTAIATLLLVKVINSAGPTFMSLVNYQVPLWALIFGMVFLSETLPASFAIALTLILAGLAISQAPTKRRR